MEINPVIWQILLQIILIALNAVFACAEIAVISMNDNKLEQMASAGDKRARRLAKLTSQPARFLATIQVAITLSGFLGSAFAAENFSDMLVEWLVGLGVKIPVKTMNAVSVVFITLILSYFTLIFGELVPKRLAMKKSESLALGMSALITFISKIFAPIVFVLTASTNFVLRLCGIDPNAEDEEVSEEEIRMMVDVGSEKGVIAPEQKEIINNLFEFDDLSADEFVTHRKDMTVLWMKDDVDVWDKTINETSFSLYPVCGDSIDNVVGVLSAKNYFRIKDKTKEAIIEQAIKPAYFVPSSVCADMLFKQMKKTHNRLAIILDEYGGVMGIVTINDLIEQLVGDLEDDETDGQIDPGIQPIEENIWRIKGGAMLEDVAKELKTSLPVDEFETFGGFVLAQHGYIPDDGSEFEVDVPPLHIKVTEVRERRIEYAMVFLDKSDTDEDSDNSKDTDDSKDSLKEKDSGKKQNSKKDS